MRKLDISMPYYPANMIDAPDSAAECIRDCAGPLLLDHMVCALRDTVSDSEVEDLQRFLEHWCESFAVQIQGFVYQGGHKLHPYARADLAATLAASSAACCHVTLVGTVSMAPGMAPNSLQNPNSFTVRFTMTINPLNHFHQEYK